MKPLLHSIRWQIFCYYTALFVAAIGMLEAGHFWMDLRLNQHQAERRMQEMGFQLLPFVFPPPEDPEPVTDPAKRLVRSGLPLRCLPTAWGCCPWRVTAWSVGGVSRH